MKKAHLLSYLGILLLLAAFTLYVQLFPKHIKWSPIYVPAEPILFSKEIPVITTFGESISDNRMQFASYERWKDEEELLFQHSDIYLFDSDTFQQDKYHKLIETLIDNNKTVLFYGYRLDVPRLLKGPKEDLIPYYTIQSDKEIYHFLYGYGFSVNKNTFLPITVMGNLTEYTMERHIANYIYKYSQEELTEEKT